MNEHITTIPKKTIVVDVDGVLFEYRTWKGIDHFGDPIQSNIDLVNALYDSGEYEICIWTTRTNDLVQGYPKQQLKEMIAKKLEESGVKYHKIADENKPLFKLMIDDNTFNPDLLKRIEIGDMLKGVK